MSSILRTFTTLVHSERYENGQSACFTWSQWHCSLFRNFLEISVLKWSMLLRPQYFFGTLSKPQYFITPLVLKICLFILSCYLVKVITDESSENYHELYLNHRMPLFQAATTTHELGIWGIQCRFLVTTSILPVRKEFLNQYQKNRGIVGF